MSVNAGLMNAGLMNVRPMKVRPMNNGHGAAHYRQWSMRDHSIHFVPTTGPSPDARQHRYFHVLDSSVWIDEAPGDPSWDVIFLGMQNGIACWGVDVPKDIDPSDGAALDLYSLFGRMEESDWFLSGRAVQLVDWMRTHRFCGRCGSRTQLADSERAYVCSSCRLSVFPRLAPAVIALVTRGEGRDQEALLAQGVNWRGQMYSCLAGFVEPGERLESAVVREIQEEVGVLCGDVQYVGSQPWPFPHSLMIGFRARYLEGDICCDPTEIADAKWFRRDELPNIPPHVSIARHIIDQWVAGK
jgi:NAD+ diphosphatase